VDIGPPAAAIRNFPSQYPEIFHAVATDEQVDCLFNILWVDPVGGLIEAYEAAFVRMKEVCRKPVVTWLYGPDRARVDEMRERLEGLGFPVFPDPETSVRALGMALIFKNLAGRSS